MLFSDAFVNSALKLKKYKGVTYSVVAQNITGLIAPGSSGINHGKCNRNWTLNPARHFVHRASRR